MSNNHPYDSAPEVPYHYYPPSDTRSVPESHSYPSNAPRAPCQVPGETTPDTDPPPFPTRPKQKTHPAVTDRTGSVHDSPIDQQYAFDQASNAMPPHSYEQTYSAHAMQHGAPESYSQAGPGYMQQQSMAQYSSSPAASMTTSWSSHQSSSTNSTGHSGRDTNSRYGRRDDGKREPRTGPAQEANVSQSSGWIWSPEYERYYYQRTNEQGHIEVVWGPKS